MATLQAVCDRLAPQSEPLRRVTLAARLADRLVCNGDDGWRYNVLPPDRISTVQGIKGIQEASLSLFDRPFAALNPERQDRVLAAVQEGFPPGQVWKTMNAHWFFLDLLAQVTELYYAHPVAPAQAATGAIIS